MNNMVQSDLLTEDQLSFDNFREQVINDYRVAYESREASLTGRKEVLTGKAKFGIFGDGKEVPQVAMAKFFKPGDFYSGYYRDQTFAFATEAVTLQQFFAQLYADPNPENEPHSAGRQMNSHFSTPFINKNGDPVDLVNSKNLAAGMAPTAGQMLKAAGLALASKTFREVEELQQFTQLSNNGNEVCFCTIGDASTSEGHFWETVNAAGVMQIPLAIFVWDDGYGISVPTKYQTTKGSISAALRGFQKKEGTNGLDIYNVKGWDYAGMCEVFEAGIQKVRDTHIPAIFHVEEVTQPQGHSTSGSHERYKSEERLNWEREWDGVKKMKEWLIENALASEEELTEVEMNAKKLVKESKKQAWENYRDPILQQVTYTLELIKKLAEELPAKSAKLHEIENALATNREPGRKDVMRAIGRVVALCRNDEVAKEIKDYYNELQQANKQLYNSQLYFNGEKSALNVKEIKPVFDANLPYYNGYEVLNKYFDSLFASNPKVVAFGEDVGKIGDVNQSFSGLQAKYSNKRIFDTGIRELTIMGQGIGMAMRGLRPIAEIQYLDYLLYGLQPLSDDLSTLYFRSAGNQIAPLIVRTRGHRLEGIWHSGSPMGVIINALRGMYICVPRNMVQAAGMYNTLMRSVDPALVIECLNGYRLKEQMPTNLLEYTVPLGIPEIIREGSDVTIVSYGSTLRIVQEAAEFMQAQDGISCEIVDVQTLLPFDIHHSILDSLKKTNRIVFVDEDVPGGAAAYMFNEVMEKQGGYRWLDVAPRTITAKDHRPAYASDGDYFAKPNVESVINVISEMMRE